MASPEKAVSNDAIKVKQSDSALKRHLMQALLSGAMAMAPESAARGADTQDNVPSMSSLQNISDNGVSLEEALAKMESEKQERLTKQKEILEYYRTTLKELPSVLEHSATMAMLASELHAMGAETAYDMIDSGQTGVASREQISEDSDAIGDASYNMKGLSSRFTSLSKEIDTWSSKNPKMDSLELRHHIKKAIRLISSVQVLFKMFQTIQESVKDHNIGEHAYTGSVEMQAYFNKKLVLVINEGIHAMSAQENLHDVLLPILEMEGLPHSDTSNIIELLTSITNLIDETSKESIDKTNQIQEKGINITPEDKASLESSHTRLNTLAAIAEKAKADIANNPKNFSVIVAQSIQRLKIVTSSK